MFGFLFNRTPIVRLEMGSGKYEPEPMTEEEFKEEFNQDGTYPRPGESTEEWWARYSVAMNVGTEG